MRSCYGTRGSGQRRCWCCASPCAWSRLCAESRLPGAPTCIDFRAFLCIPSSMIPLLTWHDTVFAAPAASSVASDARHCVMLNGADKCSMGSALCTCARASLRASAGALTRAGSTLRCAHVRASWGCATRRSRSRALLPPRTLAASATGQTLGMPQRSTRRSRSSCRRSSPPSPGRRPGERAPRGCAAATGSRGL
jgi:hypothetical protein